MVLIVFGHHLYGQTGIAFGVVKDSTNNEPLEYTTVMLYKSVNDEAITGSITDHTGAFNITPLSPGEYYALISFVGYKTKRIDSVSISSENLKINFNTVYLQRSHAILNEISIDGSRPSIDYRIDKKVISVSKQLAAQSGSAVNILESVASVQVDINGNVRLRGSTGLSVLIDGKPTLLSPGDALRQIPAKTIESIEIITNPSAKFDAEGSAGIINIISRKDKLEGVNAYANLVVGSFGRFGADFLIKYKQKNYNIYLGVDYNKRGSPGKRSRDRTTLDKDTIFRTTANGNYTNDRTNAVVRAGIEFSPAKNDILSLELSYKNWKREKTSTMDINEWTIPGDSKVINTNFETQNPGGDIFTLKSFYKRLFAKKGHQIKATFSYDYQYGEDNPVNELKSSELKIVDGKKNFETGTADLFRLKVDYDLPIAENGKFEAGLQSRFELYHDDTGLEIYNVQDGEYQVQPDFTQHTDYLRNIHSFYAMFGSEIGNFGYQFGFRGEFTDRNIENSSNPEPFTFNKLDFFPSLHFSYDLKEKNQLFASYSRRIDRPRSTWLEPFFTWDDAFNISRGNPELIPEYVDSYELGYLKKFNRNMISLESYYRVSHNKTELISGVLEDNIFLWTYGNVGRDFSLGLEFTFSYRLFEWWDFDLLGEFFNYRIEGKVADIDFSNETNSWSARFNSTFTIYKSLRLQINNMYIGPLVDAQGRFEGYYRLNAAIKTTFWDKRVSAVLEFRDVFSSVKREYNSEGPRFKTNFITQRDTPQIMFSISYRFDNQ